MPVRLRVAAALEALPATAAALADGRTHFTAVRELTRVAVADTEADWLAASEGQSVAEIEQLVSGRRSGDRPGDPPRAEARRPRIVIDVPADPAARASGAALRGPRLASNVIRPSAAMAAGLGPTFQAPQSSGGRDRSLL